MIVVVMMYYWAVLCLCGLATGSTTDEELLKAVRDGDAEAVRRLLSSGSFDPGELQFGETTMLHEAAWRGHAEVLQLLLAAWPAGAQARDTFGQVPLHVASLHGSVEVARRLLEHWPDGVKVADDKGRLPLHSAAHGSNLELVQLLVEEWPDGLNMTEDGGRTPFYVAADRKSLQVARWLFQRSPPGSYSRKLEHCEVLIELACNSSDASKSWKKAAKDLQCSDEDSLSRSQLQFWLDACGGSPSFADTFGMLRDRLNDHEAKDKRFWV